MHADKFIGNSDTSEEIRAFIRNVASASAPVLVTGPTGSGKELVARLIHDAGERANEPFIVIHCAGLSEGLIESELFGHERGSFTGAMGTHLGCFETVGKGTIFLDEVAEFSGAVQAKLLRVLQEKQFRRVGGNQLQNFEGRIVASTSQDLRDRIVHNLFREDLFFRLNVLHVALPSLASRKEDIPLLIDALSQRLQEQGVKVALTESQRKVLTEHRYSGNVRELENILRRISAMGSFPDGVEKGAAMTAGGSYDGLLQRQVEPEVLRSGLPNVIERIEAEIISHIMDSVNHNQVQAAKRLGITRGCLQYKLKKYGQLTSGGKSEYPKSHSEVGASLMEALVFGLIATVLGLAAIRMFDSLFRAGDSLSLKGDVEAIRQHILDSVNCSKSIVNLATDCVNGYAALKNSNGQEFLSSNGPAGTPMGKFHVRARCTATGLFIEKAIPVSGASFLRDPLTRREHSWSPLFPSEAMPCRDIASASESFRVVNIARLVLPLGPGVNVFPPEPGEAGTLIVPLGTVNYTPKGQRLVVTTTAKLAARGQGRGTYVELALEDVGTNTAVYSDAEHLALYGNTNGNAVGARLERKFLVNVTSGREYRFDIRLRSLDSGTSATVLGNPPLSRVDDNVEIFIEDYESQ